jgi:hypothetical protein
MGITTITMGTTAIILAIIRPMDHRSRIRQQVLSARRIHVRLAGDTHDHTVTITEAVTVITARMVIRQSELAIDSDQGIPS